MLIGIVVGILLVLLLAWAAEEDVLAETVVTLLIVGGVVSCNRSEWYQEGERQRDAERAAQAKADATPHVIREADGCKVYTFKAAEKWHYFTRCPNNTTTESHHDEQQGSGKQRKTVDVAETVVTENVK